MAAAVFGLPIRMITSSPHILCEGRSGSSNALPFLVACPNIPSDETRNHVTGVTRGSEDAPRRSRIAANDSAHCIALANALSAPDKTNRGYRRKGDDATDSVPSSEGQRPERDSV